MSPVSSPPRRIAVVLFNLGGPDRPGAIRPFLRNLFSDPAIIGLPAIGRLPLAVLISTLRAPKVKKSYARMGGGSPILPETEKQAAALEAALNTQPDKATARVFIAMRYWKPFTAETARAVAEFAPDDVVLLPLYPQFSTTTTASSLALWNKTYRGPGLVHEICCYPTQPGLVAAHAALIRKTLEGAEDPVRLLFSAHGLPKKVVDKGDPYPKQVEATASAIVEALGGHEDWQVCYQSRVGPMEWIGPSTEEAIVEACGDGIGVVICPIAFVSEHIETLVELDHDYRLLAEERACTTYLRVPALGTEPAFIGALAELVQQALWEPVATGRGGFTSEACGPICPCLETAGARAG